MRVTSKMFDYTWQCQYLNEFGTLFGTLMQSRTDKGFFNKVTVIYDSEERDQLNINASFLGTVLPSNIYVPILGMILIVSQI